MNYIELINNFWQANKEHRFTGNEIALYFYLLDTCNSLGWKNPFKHSNGYITGSLGISEKTLITSRNSLKQANLIAFDSGKNRRDLSAYEITGIKKAVKITALPAETLQPYRQEYSSLPGGNTPDNTKPNQTKLNTSPTSPSTGARETGGFQPETLERPFLESAPPVAAPPPNERPYPLYRPPDAREVVDYFAEHGLAQAEAMDFFREYAGRDWFDKGGNKMNNWQKTAHTWVKNEKASQQRREEAANNQTLRLSTQRAAPASQFDKRNQQYQTLTADSDYDEQGRRISP